MKIEKPQVEYVPIDLKIVTVVSTCDEVNSKKGSIETCTGSDAPGNNCCAGTNGFFDSNPSPTPTTSPASED